MGRELNVSAGGVAHGAAALPDNDENSFATFCMFRGLFFRRELRHSLSAADRASAGMERAAIRTGAKLRGPVGGALDLV